MLCGGCAASGTGARTMRGGMANDSTDFGMPLDPWTLGPDVFAQTKRVVEDESRADSAEAQIGSAPVPSLPADQSAAAAKVVVVTADTVAPASESTLPVDIADDVPNQPARFTVQLGTFLDRQRAQEFYDRAADQLGLSGVILTDWPFFRLRFGSYSTRESADSLHQVAMTRGFYDARVLRLTH
ncbi:MAG: SPOR domain-containing protein [bacterium]|nr:SPOR domain-containing protein [bacterium]